MRRAVIILGLAVCFMTASAIVPERPMLEQGKTWAYIYNHFEENDNPDSGEFFYEHTTWMAYYTLDGDTVIDGRQYMKLYRHDDRNPKKKYYGAYREDEEGTVYKYDYYGDKKDKKIIDFNMNFDDDRVIYDYKAPEIFAVENIKVDGLLFRRYRYKDSLSEGKTYELPYVAVEGVGIEEMGIAHYLFEPVPTCICDFESLAYVSSRYFTFAASGFRAPKEIDLSDSERQLIGSNNDFAFNLFRMARGEDNCVLSPLSITYALGMLNNGADGNTLEEINQTLGFGDAGADGINQFCQKMLSEANTLDKKTKALIANTIFVNEGLGYRLQDGFIQKANDYYNAEPQSRDFGDGQTMDVINQWGGDHTEGMIRNVLDEDTFDPAAMSYLLNALYFKGVWSSPFDVAETKDEVFGGGPTVPMMHKPYTEFEYNENNLYQAINLPYGNGAYRMTIFLPREGKIIGDVLDALSGSNWQIKGHCPEVDLKLPRFETETNIPLVEIMSALGMPTAFTMAAEFPYFCNAPAFISNMFQVAKIKLDEEGTEAAAITVIETKETAMPESYKFHATRPFLYIISEQSTNAIFFIGQFTGIDNKNTNGIDVAGNHHATKETSWYLLNGQRTTRPQQGINIVRMSDGTTKKVVVK